jgi:hypothetical protein
MAKRKSLATEEPRRLSGQERRLARMSAFCRALLSCETVAEAAAEVNISSRSATRWMKSQLFRECYAAQKANINASLAAVVTGSIARLAAIAKNPKTPVNQRLRVDIALASLWGKLDQEATTDRLAELEARLGDSQREQ